MSQVVQLMANQNYVRSPYLRASYPETLYKVIQMERELEKMMAFQRTSGLRQILPQMLDNHLARKYLVPHAMKTFVDVENLGGTEQFFQKFTFRYFLSSLLKELYHHADYRDSLTVCARARPSDVGKDDIHLTFVRFFNFMVNDTTYLVDSSIEYIRKINEYESLQKGEGSAGKWLELSKEERQRIQSNYEEGQQRLRSYLHYGNESIDLLHCLAQDLPDAFLHPALVGRLSGMLNGFLVDLTNNAPSLKLKNPSKFSFDHPNLVRKIVRCYLSFGASGVEGRDEFLRAVAADERSYTPEKFLAVNNFVKGKTSILGLGINEVMSFEALVFKIAEVHAESEADIPPEDVPEEFNCPLLQELMTDPVQLPGSGEWLQRASIVQQILNTPLNPFNRQKLTMADLEAHNGQPDVVAEAAKRREECLAWKADYLQKREAEARGK